MTDKSTFDPVAFEAMVIDEANETASTPVPEGTYMGLIDSTKIKAITPSKGQNAGQSVPILEVTYVLADDDGKLKRLLNREKVTVRQDLWLDVNDQGGLSFGPNQNVQLGRLRDACGMNKPGKAFGFKMLEGQGPLEIAVTVGVNEERGTSYNNVRSVQRPA